MARGGARLLVTARREQHLSELTGMIRSQQGEADYLAGDIADPAFRQRLIDETRRRFGELDILVNNAGVGAIGPFAKAAPERLRQIMEVNFFAPVETIRLALPLLRAGRRPIVVNVCSVLGHRAVPGKSEYCASKFALHGFSDALRAELAAERIDVLLVSPSTTESEFLDRLVEDQRRDPAAPGSAMRAGDVARRTVRAIAAGRHEILLSWGGKMLVWMDRLAPSLMNRLTARFG
jgi:short-subunit dehydrogenase